MMTDAALAAAVAAARAAQGLSASALAERSGVSRAMIAKIERAEAQPTAALLGRLSGALGLTLSELIARAELLHEGSGFAVTKADIKVEGKRVCNAEITFRVVEFPSPAFRASMQEIAATIAFPMETLSHG